MQTGLVLESELTNVELIVGLALTSGFVFQPTEEVRGRSAVPTLYFTDDALREAIDISLETAVDPVYAIREIPILRFESHHGSLIVADLWGDCKAKPFTGIKGQKYLQPNTPLITIANAAKAQAKNTPDAQVIVDIVDTTEAEIVTRTTRFQAYSSIINSEMMDMYWVADENPYPTKYARSVKRNFEAVWELKNYQ